MSIFANDKEVFKFISSSKIVIEDFMTYSEREHGVKMYLEDYLGLSAYYNGLNQKIQIEGGVDLFAFCIWEYIQKTNKSIRIKSFSYYEEEFTLDGLDIDEIKEKLLASNVIIFEAIGFEVKRIEAYEIEKYSFIERLILSIKNLF